MTTIKITDFSKQEVVEYSEERIKFDNSPDYLTVDYGCIRVTTSQTEIDLVNVDSIDGLIAALNYIKNNNK
jgi:hypothetical protein